MDPYLSIKDYMATKSFKLSDAYSVEVYDLEMDWQRTDKEAKTGDKTYENLTDLFTPDEIQAYGIETNKFDEYLTRKFTFKNCTGFTPPTYRPNEEVIKFCNSSRKVYTPNTSSCEPFQMELHETDLQYARKFIRYCLRKNLYDESYNRYTDSYRPYRYIDKIVVNVWNNSLTHIVMRHIFGNCKIADYDYKYEFDAEGSKIILPTMAFSYMTYEIDTDPDPLEDLTNWRSRVEKWKMEDYKPGQSGAYMGGYHPNAAGHGGGYR